MSNPFVWLQKCQVLALSGVEVSVPGSSSSKWCRVTQPSVQGCADGVVVAVTLHCQHHPGWRSLARSSWTSPFDRHAGVVYGRAKIDNAFSLWAAAVERLCGFLMGTNPELVVSGLGQWNLETSRYPTNAGTLELRDMEPRTKH